MEVQKNMNARIWFDFRDEKLKGHTLLIKINNDLYKSEWSSNILAPFSINASSCKIEICSENTKELLPVIEEYNFIALRDYFVKCFIVKVKPDEKLVLNIDVEENNEELRKLLEESRQKRIDELLTLKKINPD